LANIALTDGQLDDGATKRRGIVSCLNRAYYDSSDANQNALLVGSWGKKTAVRPPSDIDLFYLPPMTVYDRFNRNTGNVQSKLLQEVKGVLQATYPQTDVRGDGQVVVVAFNSVTVEVVPVFAALGGGYIICDTHDGGRWKHVDTLAELRDLEDRDREFNGNVCKITRIIKQWKQHRNVSIKGFHIEQLVKETLLKSTYGFRDEYWFDWLVRDAFLHMETRVGGCFFMPGGVVEMIELGSDWQAKAAAARERAVEACTYEYHNMEAPAGMKWQEILGTAAPVTVT